MLGDSFSDLLASVYAAPQYAGVRETIVIVSAIAAAVRVAMPPLMQAFRDIRHPTPPATMSYQDLWRACETENGSLRSDLDRARSQNAAFRTILRASGIALPEELR